MTVGQLIEKLKEFFPDLRVSVGKGCCGSTVAGRVAEETVYFNSYGEPIESYYPELHESDEDGPLEQVVRISS